MKPAIMRKSVVLPQPEGPRMVRNLPAARSSETASTATVSPKLLPTSASRTIGCTASPRHLFCDRKKVPCVAVRGKGLCNSIRNDRCLYFSRLWRRIFNYKL